MELPDLTSLEPDQRWSVCLVDAAVGAELASVHPQRSLGTASVAKVFALVELARRLEEGSLDTSTLLDRRDVAAVHDSGLWQHLQVDRLAVADVAALVGATSDNLATNVLLDALGLDRVQRIASEIAPGGSQLHDVVRDRRGASDPETLSSGCAADWARIFGALHRGEILSDAVSRRVLDWTATNTDLSLVAAVFGLDPLAHAGPDGGLRLWNKTGTDAGVRADVGLVTRAGAAVAYAVICNWDESGGRTTRRQVLDTMRETGRAILDHLEEAGGDGPRLRGSGSGRG